MQSLPHTFEVAQQTFQSDVVQRSQQTPVVLLFWTDQVPVSVETKSILERLATQFNGKFALGLIDVAREPLIARQLQIQGVPSLRVLYQGAIAMQAEGPQSEQQLRDLIQQITMSSGEKLQSTLEEVLACEDWDQALKIVRQSLLDEPTNTNFLVELADILVCREEFDEALDVLNKIPADLPDRIRPQHRLELAQEAAGMRSVDELEQILNQDESNLDAIYELAVRQAVNRQYKAALERLMQILRMDRQFRDDIGRTTMIRVMSLMPIDSPIAKDYRRQLFTYLH
ncbi:MAG: tetratricopeptide repeat protein [Gammaproteobacteria bacterium]|nr:tetratricopeptide repeat protein [Gammaproteobacteria bacterium]MXX94741.1 tetratricopeptide repeat protein [Gammaproteobacteria bacterium]MYF54140.1 tetratricopeptide repeat protein [Gammaproteobacteria bacterium]MYK43851.1 tetratricopeptide repeat protein [Gammaproteobacteria bacterium]